MGDFFWKEKKGGVILKWGEKVGEVKDYGVIERVGYCSGVFGFKGGLIVLLL